MSKEYILKKDLPDYKAGHVFVYNEISGTYDATSADEMGQVGKWPSRYVENNPEWFKEIGKFEPIVVGAILPAYLPNSKGESKSYFRGEKQYRYLYEVYLNIPIGVTAINKIKSAIEIIANEKSV